MHSILFSNTLGTAIVIHPFTLLMLELPCLIHQEQLGVKCLTQEHLDIWTQEKQGIKLPTPQLKPQEVK